MFDVNVNLNGHYHKHESDNNGSSVPVKRITGTGGDFAQEIQGNLELKATGNRTLLDVSGPAALKIVGSERIEG